MHQQTRRFFQEVAAIFLIIIGIAEILSIVDLNYTVTSNLPSPLMSILRMMLLIFSSIGIYGIIKGIEEGVYFALSASILEAVLGGYSLIRFYSFSLSYTVSIIRSLIYTALGVITCICIFNMRPLKKSNFQTRSASILPSTVLSQSLSICNYAIEVDNVFKKYFLGPIVVPALNGISLKILRGEFVAIMGPSGSGKSTLLNLIGALDQPSSGRVLIDGIDISSLDDLGLAKLRNEKIGFVFQAYNLIARSTVFRNMELPTLVKGYSKEERLKKIHDLLTIVGLNDKTPRKPKTMSGGEQQRVSIARALVNDPSILLADEPTGNIDSQTGTEIMGFLRKMNEEKGVTVIMVSHDREVAEMADRIIYLRDGKITEEEIIKGLSI